MTANKNANGATGYSDSTVEACQSRCLGMADCVAFDWDTSGASNVQRCWIHTNKDQAAVLKDATGVNHYTREQCDPGSGRLSFFQIIYCL